MAIVIKQTNAFFVNRGSDHFRDYPEKLKEIITNSRPVSDNIWVTFEDKGPSEVVVGNKVISVPNRKLCVYDDGSSLTWDEVKIKLVAYMHHPQFLSSTSITAYVSFLHVCPVSNCFF